VASIFIAPQLGGAAASPGVSMTNVPGSGHDSFRKDDDFILG
jgi:hypothetical protein